MSDPLLDRLVAALEAREAVALVTVTAATRAFKKDLGKHILIWEDPTRIPSGMLDLPIDIFAHLHAATAAALADNKHVTFEERTEQGAITCFIEVQTPPAHLIICGAGHIAVPLVAMAHLCDFEVSVIDDRAQYASAARFPMADHVLAGDFRTELASLRNGRPRFDARTCVVLVTRGHQHDVECLVELLDDPLPYIGMIGSRRRVRAVYDMLRSGHALARARFADIYAPVGLDIGAHTPAEIAVAIMGEIINVLRGGPGLSLREGAARPAHSASKAGNP